MSRSNRWWSVGKPMTCGVVVALFAICLFTQGFAIWIEAKNITTGGYIPHYEYDDIGVHWVDADVYRFNKRVDGAMHVFTGLFAAVEAAILFRRAESHVRRADPAPQIATAVSGEFLVDAILAARPRPQAVQGADRMEQVTDREFS